MLNDELATAFYVLAHLLREEYKGRMTIAIDAVHRSTVEAQPQMLYAHSLRDDAMLADLVGVLVLDPLGNLMPVSYGFGHKYWLGNLAHDLSKVCGAYLHGGTGVHKLYALGRRALGRLGRVDDGHSVFNPSDVLARASHDALSMAPADSGEAPLTPNRLNARSQSYSVPDRSRGTT